MILKENNKKTFLVMYKNNGKFYNPKGEDSYILNMLFGYKVLKDSKWVLSDVALNKVLEELQDKKISYRIIYSDKNPQVKDYKKLNKYNYYLDKARNNIKLNERIDLIVEKLNKADSKKIENIVEYLERCL